MDPIQFELLLHAVCASETAIPLINTYTAAAILAHWNGNFDRYQSLIWKKNIKHI